MGKEETVKIEVEKSGRGGLGEGRRPLRLNPFLKRGNRRGASAAGADKAALVIPKRLTRRAVCLVDASGSVWQRLDDD